jgi:colicin import membrane protein
VVEKLVIWLKKHLENADDLTVPILFSLLVHLVFIGAFSISDLFQDHEVLVKPKELKYIKTVVVNKQGKLAKKEQEATKKSEERIKEIRRKEQQQKQMQEQERIAAKKAKLEKEQKEKEALEKKNLEEKKKKEALAKKKAEEEAKEKERLKKQKQEQERQRQEALMKQRKEREAQLQQMREARKKQEALRKQREALEQQRQAQLAAQDAPILNEYEAHIQNKISQSWMRPLSARNGMQATLQINLMPGGDVANVKLIESSGDESFDLSATQAVWKASPLPVPSDAGVFTRNYRVFNLVFAPEDLWQ